MLWCTPPKNWVKDGISCVAAGSAMDATIGSGYDVSALHVEVCVARLAIFLASSTNHPSIICEGDNLEVINLLNIPISSLFHGRLEIVLRILKIWFQIWCDSYVLRGANKVTHSLTKNSCTNMQLQTHALKVSDLPIKTQNVCYYRPND